MHKSLQIWLLGIDVSSTNARWRGSQSRHLMGVPFSGQTYIRSPSRHIVEVLEVHKKVVQNSNSNPACRIGMHLLLPRHPWIKAWNAVGPVRIRSADVQLPDDLLAGAWSDLHDS